MEPDGINLEELMTPEEVSEQTGLSLHTLKNWRHRKIKIQYVKKGNRIFYEPEEVRAAMQRYHRVVEVNSDG